MVFIGCTSFADDQLEQCLNDQVDLYYDLCGESANGYEHMDGAEAHFEGVKCAVEGVHYCMEMLKIPGPVRK